MQIAHKTGFSPRKRVAGRCSRRMCLDAYDTLRRMFVDGIRTNLEVRACIQRQDSQTAAELYRQQNLQRMINKKRKHTCRLVCSAVPTV